MEDCTEGKAKILLIDDEEIILALATDVLNFIGYIPVTSDDGRKAVDLVREHQPSLVFVDFHMPNIMGEKVLENLKKEFPDLKILITSGRELDDDEVARLNKKGALGIMGKPFTISELEEKIKEMLPAY
jgi:two-component system response regulator (stage 0 sporulation protein F)